MGFESNTGLNVNNHYGERPTGQTSGNFKTEGPMNKLSIQVNSADIDVALFGDPVLPAGALVTGAYVRVTEAFVLGGTTPTILTGTESSEVTNGLVLSEAQAEAIGLYDIFSTVTGTWAAMLAAETAVAIVLGGGSPTKTAAGKMEVVIEYIEIVV